MELRRGLDVLGHRLVRRHAKGAFGEVWEARDRGENRVALKLILKFCKVE